MTTGAAPRIKVCGLTRFEDASLALELGAWALGFVFHEASPRAASPKAAGEILRELRRIDGTLDRPRRGFKAVGVFVDPGLSQLEQAVRESGVDALQLHGDESPELLREVRRSLPELELIKAFRLSRPEDLARLREYKDLCESFLIDAHVEGAWGGTGVVADWGLARQAKTEGRIILAGGLKTENVRQALRETDPFALDVSSGLESTPGIKSEAKLREFFKKAGE